MQNLLLQRGVRDTSNFNRSKLRAYTLSYLKLSCTRKHLSAKTNSDFNCTTLHVHFQSFHRCHFTAYYVSSKDNVSGKQPEKCALFVYCEATPRRLSFVLFRKYVHTNRHTYIYSQAHTYKQGQAYDAITRWQRSRKPRNVCNSLIIYRVRFV